MSLESEKSIYTYMYNMDLVIMGYLHILLYILLRVFQVYLAAQALQL